MLYQCKKCKKVYYRKELLEEGNYKVTKRGLIPICPNCKGKSFSVYYLKKIKKGRK